MSQSIRQSELFTSQDWTVLYKALTQINFNASDPPSIAKALRQYIQTNYAEDFNDWIAQSEMVMVTDTLSWLAGILAYKTDVSARENFMAVATARQSILRLARFLSYSPRRNQTAQGLLKVVGLQTNDDVYDAFGNNLNGVLINWNDPNNTDWFEQTAQILNAALVPTNPFGVPLSSGTYNGVKTQIYRLNATFGANQPSLPFTAYLDGQSTSFETINLDYDETLGFIERAPDLQAALNFAYLSDGFGNASPNTGFFFGFKQGQLQSSVFTIPTPVENQLLDVAVDNINQTDVWFQTIDGNGATLINWTPVPVVFSDNITFNSLPSSQRNIFSVITRENDQISLRFSDGRFANAPSGSLRCWYRVSNGLAYQIAPADMGNPKINLTYVNRRGQNKTLTLTLELQSRVANSAPAETIEQIRRRASLVYATQNRMVSGQDYNTYPLQSNLATKLKALSRTYSGQSRFIDLNDPTSTYQDTTVFADDGSFYSEYHPAYVEIPLSDNLTASQLLDGFIQPALTATETINWFQNQLLIRCRSNAIVIPSLSWTEATSTNVSSTGYFNVDNQYLRQGAIIHFVGPDGSLTWAGITSVTGSTTTVPPTSVSAGPVALAAPIATASAVVTILPRYAATLTATLRTTIIAKIAQNLSFELWYDYAVTDETAHFSTQNKGYVPNATQFKIMTVDCISGAIWRIKNVGLRYVFESRKATKFFYDGATAVDIETGQIQRDVVSVLDINMQPNSTFALGRNYDLAIDKMIRYANGYQDPARATVKFIDSDNDGFPDDPDTYFQLVSNNVQNTYLFWQQTSPQSYSAISSMIVFERDVDRMAALGVNVGTVVFQISSSTLPNTFWQMTMTGWVENWRDYRYGIGRGLNFAAKWVTASGIVTTSLTGADIRYMWKHYVAGDRRIDPSRSNIIDMFVLPTEYDTLVRAWIAAGCILANEPPVWSDFQLAQSFATYEPFKMFSDDIVWRPAKYRYLFGQTADPALRAQFKVVKLSTTTLSDGEIQAKVLTAIATFFDTDYWDFGETFYYTEMSAFLHTSLAGIVSSIVIVPEVEGGSFGDLFEIDCRADELFIATAQLSDIIMINSNTSANLRIR